MNWEFSGKNIQLTIPTCIRVESDQVLTEAQLVTELTLLPHTNF